MLSKCFCSFLLAQEITTNEQERFGRPKAAHRARGRIPRVKEGHPRGVSVFPHLPFDIGYGIKHVFHTFSDIQLINVAEPQAGVGENGVMSC
jgi:hypothetical protein